MGIIQLSQIIVGFILVRLLSPRDYGLAGMALVFSSLVLLLSDLSMGAALVQRREITEADRSTVFWASAGVGTFLTISGVALSEPLANFYHQPKVAPLFAAISLTFWFASMQTTQASVLQREMRFRLLNLRVAAGAVAGGVAGVLAALLDAGAWALIIQQITVGAVGTLLLWMHSTWRPRFMFSWRSLRDLGGYGLNMLGANMLAYAKNNGDNMLVGRFLGSGSLGIYAVAYNLMFLPVGRVVVPIQDALFPALSRWQDDLEKLSSVWLRVLRMVAAALTPAMFGLAVVAPDFVNVVFGRKWHSATPVLQLLAFVALAQCLALVGQRVLGAVDKTTLIFRFAIIDTLISLGAFAIGLRWGIVGVGVCYVLASVPLQIVYVWLTARAVNASLREVSAALSGVVSATCVMAAACFALRIWLVGMHVPALPRLALVVAAGIATYTAACVVLEPHVKHELLDIRSSRRRRREIPVPA